MGMDMNRLNVFNIQRFSVHDGPGIRTTVFLKGCGLRCVWCHNPESIPFEPLLQFYKDKCIGCETCKRVCEDFHDGAQLPVFENYPYLSGKCFECGKCINECPASALVMVDRHYDIDELYDIVLRDRIFYEKSSGGVTFSGGEPLLQYEALVPLLCMLKSGDKPVHIAVDTAGYVKWTAFEAVLPYTDLFLYDIKAIDPALHERGTCRDNALILDNLERLYDTGRQVVVRIPEIPGFNNNPECKQEIVDFLKQYPRIWDGNSYEYMPYHNLGEGKYAVLNMKYEMHEILNV